MQVSAVFSVSKLNSSVTEIFLLIVRLFMDFKHFLKRFLKTNCCDHSSFAILKTLAKRLEMTSNIFTTKVQPRECYSGFG